MIDLYPLDFDDPRTIAIEDPPWESLLSDPRIMGVWLKASDGTRWSDACVQWFIRNYRKLIQLIGEHRGKDFMLGAYAFLQLLQDGTKQANYLHQILLQAGWTPGLDMIPVMDLESGGESHPNRSASASQIVDCGSSFSAQMARFGTETMLYARGIMRDKGITDRMGCRRASNASYTRYMSTHGYVPPFELTDIREWQYAGDGVGDTAITGLPLKIAGHGVDLSVAIHGSDKPTLAMAIEGLR